MRFGVHCSVRGGLINALDEATRLGCDTLQIFTRAPRLWRSAALSDENAAAFRARLKETGLTPLVVHTPYLPNLCTSDPALYERSQQALRDDLSICHKIEADFLVIHPGSYSDGATPAYGISRLAAAMNAALENSEGHTRILIENMAGGGRRLGSTWEELHAMLSAIQNKMRIGICLDTAHTLGAGHPLSTAKEVAQTLDTFDTIVGLSNVYAIHANDSKAERGSHRDLHEHIGKGHVGLAGFRAILNDPRLAHCAVILETPKGDEVEDWDRNDRKNLAALRKLTSTHALKTTS